MSTTMVIAHRGFSAAAPENTLVAFQKAIDIGAHYIELDVQRSKDNALVVIHDKSVNRTVSNGQKGLVERLNYPQLSSISVGYRRKFGVKYANEPVPTLRQALELAKGKIKVCVEVKVKGIEAEVVDTIKRVGIEHDVVIFSFIEEVIERVTAIDSQIPTLLLSVVCSSAIIEKACSLGAMAVGVGCTLNVPKHFIENAHARGLQVWVWTVNSAAKMKSLTKKGVDALITNHPDIALSVVNM